MTSQGTGRQQARRAVLDARSEIRKLQAERDKRRGALAVTVVTALAQRDSQVELWERRAGEALHELIEKEGLTLHEAIQWCANRITLREAVRLRQASATGAVVTKPATGAESSTPCSEASPG